MGDVLIDLIATFTDWRVISSWQILFTSISSDAEPQNGEQYSGVDFGTPSSNIHHLWLPKAPTVSMAIWLVDCSTV
jgi:hypothetical protein